MNQKIGVYLEEVELPRVMCDGGNTKVFIHSTKPTGEKNIQKGRKNLSRPLLSQWHLFH